MSNTLPSGSCVVTPANGGSPTLEPRYRGYVRPMWSKVRSASSTWTPKWSKRAGRPMRAIDVQTEITSPTETAARPAASTPHPEHRLVKLAGSAYFSLTIAKCRISAGIVSFTRLSTGAMQR